MSGLNKKNERFVQEYLIDPGGKQTAIRANVDFIPAAKVVGFFVCLLMDTGNLEIFHVGKGKGRRFKSREAEGASGNIANVEEVFAYPGNPDR